MSGAVSMASTSDTDRVSGSFRHLAGLSSRSLGSVFTFPSASRKPK